MQVSDYYSLYLALLNPSNTDHTLYKSSSFKHNPYQYGTEKLPAWAFCVPIKKLCVNNFSVSAFPGNINNKT